MHTPTSVHHQAALKVLIYLSGTPNQGILLASNSSAMLTAYCESVTVIRLGVLLVEGLQQDFAFT